MALAEVRLPVGGGPAPREPALQIRMGGSSAPRFPCRHEGPERHGRARRDGGPAGAETTGRWDHRKWKIHHKMEFHHDAPCSKITCFMTPAVSAGCENIHNFSLSRKRHSALMLNFLLRCGTLTHPIRVMVDGRHRLTPAPPGRRCDHFQRPTTADVSAVFLSFFRLLF